MPLTRRHLLHCGIAAMLAAPPASAAAEPVRVAAASDLYAVLPEIAKAFDAETGLKIAATFGSTGNFARQIRQGAPFEVFLAADDSVVAGLHKDGIIAAAGMPYAEGRLALIAGVKSPFTGDLTLGAIADAARNGQRFRFAIANPEHAPYGQRALDILERWSIADLLRPRLVYGDNVIQAMQFVAAGAAEAGIAALSPARAPVMTGVLSVEPMPTEWHRPLIQTLALTAKAGAGARRLKAFLVTARARALLRDAGFGIPGD